MVSGKRTDMLKWLYKAFGLRDADLERKRVKMEEDLFVKMERTISGSELYKDRSLSADSLARALGTNRQYLYRTLKGRGLRFTQYINTFRLQKALLLMSSPECASMTMDDIAFSSGFSSDRTMNYYVLKMLGVTAPVLRRRFGAVDKDRA